MIENYRSSAEALVLLAEEAKAIRNSLEGGRRVSWPQSVKRRALDIAESGISISQISFATGISIGSLTQWRNKTTEAETPETDAQSGIGFSELKMVARGRPQRGDSFAASPQNARPPVTLIGPRGFRIEKLEWAAFRELLQLGLILGRGGPYALQPQECQSISLRSAHRYAFGF